MITLEQSCDIATNYNTIIGLKVIYAQEAPNDWVILIGAPDRDDSEWLSNYAVLVSKETGKCRDVTDEDEYAPEYQDLTPVELPEKYKQRT